MNTTTTHVKPPLVLVDGSMLRRLQKDYPDSPITVVFDAKGKTFRDELYAEYKTHRPPMPDELREQIQPIHDIVAAMGLPLLIIPGVEADDVIGTLAQQATELSLPVIISTGDKDMAQLVNEHITLVNTMTSTVLDPDGVEEKFGVPPALIIDYLALVGDKADNIPGVPGVGEKTALAILQGIGDMDAIYDDLEKVRSLGFRGAKKMPEKLAEHKEQGYLSRQLATIKLDVPLDISADQLANAPEDQSQLLALFKAVEFKSWVEELLDRQNAAADDSALETTHKTENQYSTILTQADFDLWLQRLEQAELFAFDTETTSLNYMQAQLVGVSFAISPHEAAYLPFAHDYLGAPSQLDRAAVLAQLKPLLENPAHAKVGQNLKYDMSVLARYDITLQGIAYDTMLESYVLNSTGSRHDMDTLALTHLGESTTHFEDVAGKGKSQLTFNQITIEEATPYAAEDADITLRLHQNLWPRLSDEKSLASVFTDGEILFTELDLPVIKKTPKGAPSTAEAVLAELALDYPLPKIILEHRSLSKLKSTYTDKLPTMIDRETGRIHTSYHQAVTATGRLSSSDPNLQNIPVRSEEGRRIRQAFIASKGCTLIAADYSQIELRIMAHLSGDKGLLDAFAHGLDVHQATAAEVFGVELDPVSSDQRRNAKAINFGLIYGMSAFGLGRQLNIGRNQAQEYIDLYFERYPGVKAYMETIKTSAAEKGYVETLFGRRLYLPQINARNGMQRQAAERTAINAPMQGTAADIIKKAMIAVDQWLLDKGENSETKIIMQVHDELVLEVPNNELDDITAGLRQRMEAAAELDIPLIVDIGSGQSWDEAH